MSERNIKHLTKQEEKIVIRRAQEGDRNAQDMLIRPHMGILHELASKYDGFGIPKDDIISCAMIGLLRAIPKFDVGKSNKFITYGIWWARASINKLILKELCTIRIPQEKLLRISEFKKRVFNIDNKRFSDKGIDYLHKLSRTISISTAITPYSDEGKDWTLEALIGRPSEIDIRIEEQDNKHVLGRLFECLNKQQKTIVSYYWGLGDNLPMNLTEIAKIAKMSKERSSKIYSSALRKLKRRARSKLNDISWN